jgi:hypothetical protein
MIIIVLKYKSLFNIFLSKTKLDILDSIKRDSTNEAQKYEQEKSILINKFERTKQQWTEIFKPQFVFQMGTFLFILFILNKFQI